MNETLLFAINDAVSVRIDAADLPRVAEHHWHAVTDRAGRTTVRTNLWGEDGRSHLVALHRYLLDLPARWPTVRFLNGDTLDMTRANLVADTRRTISAPATTSCYRGVSWVGGGKPWRAEIRVKGAHTFLGHWTTEEEAADAYDLALLAAGGNPSLTNRAMIARAFAPPSPEPSMTLVVPQRPKRQGSSRPRNGRIIDGRTHTRW